MTNTPRAASPEQLTQFIQGLQKLVRRKDIVKEVYSRITVSGNEASRLRAAQRLVAEVLGPAVTAVKPAKSVEIPVQTREADGIADWFGKKIRGFILDRPAPLAREALFSVADVADALDMDRDNAKRSLDKRREDKGGVFGTVPYCHVMTAGGPQELRLLTAEELVHLTNVCKSPKAAKFRIWLEEQGANILAGKPTRMPIGEEDPTGNSTGGATQFASTLDLIIQTAQEMKRIEAMAVASKKQIEEVKDVVNSQGKEIVALSGKVDSMTSLANSPVARPLPSSTICQDELRVAVTEFVNANSLNPDGSVNTVLRDNLYREVYGEGYTATGIRGSKGRSKLKSHSSEQCLRFLHHLHLAVNGKNFKNPTAFIDAYNKLAGIN